MLSQGMEVGDGLQKIHNVSQSNCEGAFREGEAPEREPGAEFSQVLGPHLDQLLDGPVGPTLHSENALKLL